MIIMKNRMISINPVYIRYDKFIISIFETGLTINEIAKTAEKTDFDLSLITMISNTTNAID